MSHKVPGAVIFLHFHTPSQHPQEFITMKGFILPLNSLYLSMFLILCHKNSSYKMFKISARRTVDGSKSLITFMSNLLVHGEYRCQFSLFPPSHAPFPLSCDYVFASRNPFLGVNCTQSEFSGSV